VIEREALEADALRAFGVFAEHLNFTTAAAVLHISQPALHVKIRKLSAALGVELYERRGRGLVLTDAGLRLAAFGREHRRQVEDFLTDLQPGSAPVTLAAGRGALRWVLGDGIRRLVDSGRPVRVLATDREASLGHVASGRADVAVIAQEPPPVDLCQRELARFPQVLVLPAAHPLAARDGVTMRELDGLDLILPPRGRRHRDGIERALRTAGVSWRVTAEVDGWDLLVHFVALGLGATVVNGCVPAPPGLAGVPVTDLPDVGYWAAWRSPRDLLVSDVLGLLAP